MAKVREIQVCGGIICTTLEDTCRKYLSAVSQGVDREKLHFSIILDTGEGGEITFRDWDGSIEVYGDFNGMPDFLEWSRRQTNE